VHIITAVQGLDPCRKISKLSLLSPEGN